MEPSKPFTVSICSTLARAFRHLARYLYSPAEGEPPTLDSLPTEILALISDYLPVESQLSLSLACKKMLFALPLERTRANRDVKAVGQFLVMLMRYPGFPSMFLCLSCPKLYNWKQYDGFWEARCQHWICRAPYACAPNCRDCRVEGGYRRPLLLPRAALFGVLLPSSSVAVT
jgi:hypothetical protein